MTVISDDPSWWPFIDASHLASYFVVAASVGAIYDWVLSFEQEVELIWRQRWSLMTILYLSVRYGGIVFAVIDAITSVQTISVTDLGCFILYSILNLTNIVAAVILGVIMITRLHAMYQRSKMVLIVLIAVFLPVNIFDIVVVVLSLQKTSGEEVILSGTYECSISAEGDILLLDPITWLLAIVWEVLALSLAVWIAVQHFHELRRHAVGGFIGDCFKVLVKSHVIYFASSVVVSCLQISCLLSANSMDPFSLETDIYVALLRIFTPIQSFVLGPRLILGLREYHAMLVADSDMATGMSSIVFQECVHVSTSSNL